MSYIRPGSRWTRGRTHASGVVVLLDGRILSGDFYYSASYTFKNGKWRRELTTGQRTDAIGVNFLSGGSEVSCGFAGSYGDGPATVEVTALVGKKSVPFRADLAALFATQPASKVVQMGCRDMGAGRRGRPSAASCSGSSGSLARHIRLGGVSVSEGMCAQMPSSIQSRSHECEHDRRPLIRCGLSGMETAVFAAIFTG